MNELVETSDHIICTKCGQLKTPGKTKGWCVDCESAYNKRYSYLRRHPQNWQEVAADSGLELWERQPLETELEWKIWVTYRDAYPSTKPNYRDVAAKVDTTYNYVAQTASRWSFAVRMQAWIAYCDKVTVAQRRQEIINMNSEYIDMAKRLRAKLSTAIDQLDPQFLRPADLNGLMKTVAELEKKSRVDQVDTMQAMYDSFVDNDNPDLRKVTTKQTDLGEVVNILLNAGALGDITTIGVRKTEEIVVKKEE